MSTEPVTIDTFISCGRALIEDRLIADSESRCWPMIQPIRNIVTVFNRHVRQVPFSRIIESDQPLSTAREVPDCLDEGRIPRVPDAQDYVLKSNAIAVGFIEDAEITIPHRQYDGLQEKRRALLCQIEGPLQTVKLCQFYNRAADGEDIAEEQLEPEIIEGDNRISHYFPPTTRPKKAT